MPTGQSNVDSPLLKLSSQVVLGCIKLTVQSDHHTLYGTFVRTFYCKDRKEATMWVLLFSPFFSHKRKHKGAEYIVAKGPVSLKLRISFSRPELFTAASSGWCCYNPAFGDTRSGCTGASGKKEINRFITSYRHTVKNPF